MDDRDAERAEGLDRYWDALVSRDLTDPQPPREYADATIRTNSDATISNATDAATIRSLHAYSRTTPPANAAFAAQLWSDLMTSPSIAPEEQSKRAGATSGPLLWRRTRARLAYLITAGLLIGGSAIAYLRVQEPTAVSAQLIIQRATKAMATPHGRVLHEIDVITGSMTGRSEKWIELDSGGRLVRIASTWVYGHNPKAWTLRTRRTFQLYDPVKNLVTITTQPPSPCDGPPFQQPWVDQYRQLLSYEHGMAPVSRQMLDGHDVYVLGSSAPKALTPGLNIVWYIDAHSYLPRGLDEIHVSAKRRIMRVTRDRITRYESLPLTAVPARAFQFHAPAGARIERGIGFTKACAATFSQLLSVPGQPVVLPAGHVDGLYLSTLQLGINPCNEYVPGLAPGGIWTEHQYDQRKTRYPSRGQMLCLATSFASAHNVAATVPRRFSRTITITAPAHILRIRIAGQTIVARYMALSEPYGERVQALWYLNGGHATVIASMGMNRTTFFSVVGKLVNGRTHPAAIRSAQRDLDALHLPANNSY